MNENKGDTFPESVAKTSKEQSDAIDAELNKSKLLHYIEESVRGFTGAIDNQRAITSSSFSSQPASVSNSPQQFRETAINISAESSSAPIVPATPAILTLQVCIDGVKKNVDFYIAGGPHDTA